MRYEILWITLDHETNLTNSQTIDRLDWPPFLKTFIEGTPILCRHDIENIYGSSSINILSK